MCLCTSMKEKKNRFGMLETVRKKRKAKEKREGEFYHKNLCHKGSNFESLSSFFLVLLCFCCYTYTEKEYGTGITCIYER